MDKFYKELTQICLKATLFEMAVKNRVDFFELIRSTSVEEYNRTCPLCPLEDSIYTIYKNIIKEIK